MSKAVIKVSLSSRNSHVSKAKLIDKSRSDYDPEIIPTIHAARVPEYEKLFQQKGSKVKSYAWNDKENVDIVNVLYPPSLLINYGLKQISDPKEAHSLLKGDRKGFTGLIAGAIE